MDNIVVVIPCFNEAETIGDIVSEVKRQGANVIVSDDKSTDATVYWAEVKGAFVVKSNENCRGAGRNTRRGILVGRVGKSDIVVTLDGDGQHNPAEMLFLVEPIRRNEADVVIGSRFLEPHNDDMPRYRAFGIKAITWLVNIFSTVKFTDAQCGYRAFTIEALDKLPIEDNGFGFSVEMLIKARKNGLRIKEIPVTSLYHKEYRRNSTLNPIKHGLVVSWAVIKWRIKCAF